jgi:hypothetical protein
MPDPTDSRYQQARRRFDELDLEEQSRFLIEATASTLADGVKQAGTLLADGIEETIRRSRKASASSDPGSRPGAAEPETAQRRRPRSDTGSSPDRS